MDKRDKELDKPFKVSFDEGILNRYLEDIQVINSYSEFPEITKNPFLCGLNGMLRKGYKSDKDISGVVRDTYVNSKTGELLPITASIRFGHVQIVDRNKFVKIYGDTLKEMFSLNHPGLQVYGYIISQMVGNKEATEVYFRVNDCIQFCGYKAKSMVYIGLTELIKKGFIAKTDRPPSFFVNPLYAFNGDVVDTHKRYILEGSESEKEFIATQNEHKEMLLEDYEQENTDKNEEE